MLPTRTTRLLLVLFGLALTPAAVCAAGKIEAVGGRPPAPALALPDMDGTVRDIAEFRGRVVAVNFWATWCPPCRKEMPSMQRTYAALRERGFAILAVDIGEDRDSVSAFLDSLDGMALEFPLLLDTETRTMGEWEVIGLPTTVFVDREGRISHRLNGARDWDDPAVRQAIEEMLGPPR